MKIKRFGILLGIFAVITLTTLVVSAPERNTSEKQMESTSVETTEALTETMMPIEETEALIEEITTAMEEPIETEPQTIFELGEPVTNYTNDDLYWLSMVIAQEASSDWIPDWVQQGVASVVINRVNNEMYPNSIYDVLHQNIQYCGFNMEPTEKNIANAQYVLDHGPIFPDNVIFQAGFTQGDGIYATYYDEILGTTMYFCYRGE